MKKAIHLSFSLLLLSGYVVFSETKPSSGKYNVLFIISDDLQLFHRGGPAYTGGQVLF